MARIEDNFDVYRAEDLKRIAKRWGKNAPARTGDCPEFIREALDNPARVKAFIEALKPFELAALGLIKLTEGHITAGALSIALRAAGVPLPEGRTWSLSRADSSVIEELVKNGLLLGMPRDFQFFFDWGSSAAQADERLLAKAPPLRAIQPALAPAREPAAAQMRRPQIVMLDVLMILQAIDRAGSLRVTRTGSLRASDERKLTKELGWTPDVLEIDGLEFPHPMYAFISVYVRAGLLTIEGDALSVSHGARELANAAPADITRRILFGFTNAEGWFELGGNASYYGEGRRYSQARIALLTLLAALPDNQNQWHSIDHFSEELYSRIGEYFSIHNAVFRPNLYQRTAAEVKRFEDEWSLRIHAAWRNSERPWIAKALSTWLYFLGIIELGMDGKMPAAFRLTAFGRAVLHPELAGQDAVEPKPGGPAWIVQPNMEIVVYLENAGPTQMAFLEAHAERLNVQQHTAHYRLTRDSVYHGLEGGTHVDRVLDTLRAGSAHELPQNVRVEIMEWARLRERMTLRQRARLLEYGSQSARDLALRGEPRAIALGERFMLLPHEVAAKGFRPRKTINYHHPLPPCLVVDEKGEIKLASVAHDLLVEAQLDRWAQRTGEGKWQFTQTSVANAMQHGTKRRQLSEWLSERLVEPLPELIAVALNAWMGQKIEVGLSKVTLLQCKKQEVFDAIAGSPALKEIIEGVLAPDLILIKDHEVERFRTMLDWMGLRVTDGIQSPERWDDYDEQYHD